MFQERLRVPSGKAVELRAQLLESSPPSSRHSRVSNSLAIVTINVGRHDESSEASFCITPARTNRDKKNRFAKVFREPANRAFFEEKPTTAVCHCDAQSFVFHRRYILIMNIWLLAAVLLLIVGTTKATLSPPTDKHKKDKGKYEHKVCGRCSDNVSLYLLLLSGRDLCLCPLVFSFL